MGYTEDEPVNGELIPAENNQRMSAGSIDELYIECFLDNPSSKVGALRKAAELSAIECNTSRARAIQIHQRLQHKIDAGLTKRIIEGATLGYSVLYKLAADDMTGEAVRAKCASLLIEYAGKNKLTANDKQDRSRRDVKQDIEQVKARLLEIGIKT